MNYQELILGILLYFVGCAFWFTPKMKVMTIPIEIETVEIEIEGTQTYSEVQDADMFLEYVDLVTNTTKQLKQWAREERVKGYSRLRKGELVQALMV